MMLLNNAILAGFVYLLAPSTAKHLYLTISTWSGRRSGRTLPKIWWRNSAAPPHWAPATERNWSVRIFQRFKSCSSPSWWRTGKTFMRQTWAKQFRAHFWGTHQARTTRKTSRSFMKSWGDLMLRWSCHRMPSHMTRSLLHLGQVVLTLRRGMLTSFLKWHHGPLILGIQKSVWTRQCCSSSTTSWCCRPKGSCLKMSPKSGNFRLVTSTCCTDTCITSTKTWRSTTTTTGWCSAGWAGRLTKLEPIGCQSDLRLLFLELKM